MTDQEKLKAYKQLVDDLSDCLDEVCYEKDWCRDPTPENMVASAVRLLQDFFDGQRKARDEARGAGEVEYECGLCGKSVDGFSVVYEGQTEHHLCHPDDPKRPDCYHLWTMYGKRPSAAPPEPAPGLHRMVSAAGQDSWCERCGVTRSELAPTCPARGRRGDPR